jgi:hypothetical protein
MATVTSNLRACHYRAIIASACREVALMHLWSRESTSRCENDQKAFNTNGSSVSSLIVERIGERARINQRVWCRMALVMALRS